MGLKFLLILLLFFSALFPLACDSNSSPNSPSKSTPTPTSTPHLDVYGNFYGQRTYLSPGSDYYAWFYGYVIARNESLIISQITNNGNAGGCTGTWYAAQNTPVSFVVQIYNGANGATASVSTAQICFADPSFNILGCGSTLIQQTSVAVGHGCPTSVPTYTPTPTPTP